MKIAILGAGGFIGSHLVEHLDRTTDHVINASDCREGKLRDIDGGYFFHKLNLISQKDWPKLDDLIRDADLVINCAAYANPSIYVQDPLGVFELNFQRNLDIVRACVEHKVRLIQFSSCEVYGMSQQVLQQSGQVILSPRLLSFHEDSPSILGPVSEHRWIYANAKQLLERVIHAYGLRGELEYTILRPFNFIGPRIDFLPSEQKGLPPRVFSCFLDAIMNSGTLKLVNGGLQQRAYTYIDDAVDCIHRVIDAPVIAQSEIFNIGSPDNETTIRGLATLMVSIYKEHFDPNVRPVIAEVTGEEFYGAGYADCDRRVPNVDKAEELLDWRPRTNLKDALLKTMSHFCQRERASTSAG